MLAGFGARVGESGTGGRSLAVERSGPLVLAGSASAGEVLAGDVDGKLGLSASGTLDALFAASELGRDGSIGAGFEKLGTREGSGIRYCAVTAPAVTATAIPTAMKMVRLALLCAGGRTCAGSTSV
jgi:hypothetical protein